jgi:hypothetical protein
MGLSSSELEEALTHAVAARLFEHFDVLSLRLGPEVAASVPSTGKTTQAQLDGGLRAVNGMDTGTPGDQPLATWLRWAAQYAPPGDHRRYFEALLREHCPQVTGDKVIAVKRTRGPYERIALTVEVYTDGRRRYRTGRAVLGEARFAGSAAHAEADPFAFLFPEQAGQGVFKQLGDNPSAAGHSVACRVALMDPASPAWPLWNLRAGEHRLQLFTSDTSLWTVEFGAGAGGEATAVLPRSSVPRVALFGEPTPLFEAVRGRLQARSAEYKQPDSVRALGTPEAIRTALRVSPPHVAILTGPVGSASLAELVTFIAQRPEAERPAVVFWCVPEPAARASVTQALPLRCLVDLGAGAAPTREALLVRLLEMVVLEGTDPVAALHDVALRECDDTAHRDHVRTQVRPWANYGDWDAGRVPRRSTPHPRTTLDRREQRRAVASTLQDQHSQGHRISIMVGVGRSEDDLVGLGPALQRHLRDIDPQTHLFAIPPRPLKKPSELGADPPDWFCEKYGLTSDLPPDWAKADDEHFRAFAHGLAARMRQGGAPSGLHWFDVGVGRGLTATESVARLDGWWRFAERLHPHFGEGFGRFVLYAGVLPEAAVALRRHHEEWTYDRKVPCEVLSAVSERVTKLDLKNYFTDPRYSPDTADREKDLTPAVWKYTRDGDYQRALRAIVFGATNSWERLVTLVEAGDFAPIDACVIDFDLFDRPDL